MVRFEKLIYEQVCNLHLLKRGRTIAAPQKWFNENRYDAYQVAGQKVFLSGISGKIFSLIEPIVARFTYQWWRNIALQRGLALEDFFLHQDRQLRRCAWWEKIVRDSCHPYQWIFAKRRRYRYYKVERALRGCFAPDWARAEGANRLFSETIDNKEIWENYVFKEYMSDITPSFRMSPLGKWTVLDLIIPYGLFRVEAWDRYFLNEVRYDGYTQADIQNSFSQIYPQDLNTATGRQSFEEQVNRFNHLYPGAVARDGEQFNFQKLYAAVAIETGADTSSYQQELINELQAELAANKQILITDGTDNLTGSAKHIGSEKPDFIKPASGKAHFAQ